ncbi:FtsJ-like protein [Gracilaria domingensis]|nr:FtsJ-like protein [Gracilaria domingensis]
MGRSNEGHTDIYYRRAKALGYRARSAFKLQQLDDQYDLFSRASSVLDLCGAPGSWSQYIVHRFQQLDRLQRARILSVDLQEMLPIAHVTTMQADITKPKTIAEIVTFFEDHGGVDVVVCDGAPDVTGLHDIDEYVHSHLLNCAINVVQSTLKPRGTFVAKIFRQQHMTLLQCQLSVLFDEVHVVKPRSSRASSIEAFAVCKFYTPNHTRAARDFLAHGDISSFDIPLLHSGPVNEPPAAYKVKEEGESGK